MNLYCCIFRDDPPWFFDCTRFREFVQNDKPAEAAAYYEAYNEKKRLLCSVDSENRTALHIVFLIYNFKRLHNLATQKLQNSY